MVYLYTALRHLTGLSLIALISCVGSVIWLTLLLAMQEGFEQPLQVYSDWLLKILIPSSIRDGFLGNFFIMLLIVFQQMGINKWESYFKLPRILGMGLIHSILMYLIVVPRVDIDVVKAYLFTPPFVISFVINSVIMVTLLGFVIKNFHLPQHGTPMAVGGESYGGDLENNEEEQLKITEDKKG